ncbi:hypothetical protein DVH05_017164 [Phytophthora capsici]|nr:hypothetical protein DVH05_017164 [Phytophthora capsici]
MATKDAINSAVQSVGPESAKLFKTQYGLTSDRQVDRLRMTGIPKNDYKDVDKYMFCDYWVCVITSEYTLRQLSKIVEPSYYQDLWEHANQLGDDGLMGIAFENYVHTLARDGKKIMLRVRTYGREKEKEAHTYEDLDIEPKLCRNDAKDTAECDAAMKRFATSSDDYWYPSCRALETIDCVARLDMDGQSNVVLLIQITKSNSHSIASKAINKYARFFSNRCVYIALVPDKQTCDAFRLAPVIPATEVPLKVAYFKKFPQPSSTLC